MWVDVVRLRAKGQKRRREDVLSERPQRAQFTIERAEVHRKAWQALEPVTYETAAFLRAAAPAEGGDVVYVLHDARVARLTHAGGASLIVTGIEVFGSIRGDDDRWPQAWWCRMVPEREA